MERYDLIVLGGGPAGYVAAERAGGLGMRTLLLEERALGGVCLNEGCIPSKTLLYSAKLYRQACHGDAYGVHGQATLDHSAVVDRKDKTVRTLIRGIEMQMKASGVTVVRERGSITGREGEDFLLRAGEAEFRAPKLLVATGSEPVLPPIKGLSDALESGFALTNREVLDLREVPGELCIVGGGVIGLEMAAYFSAAGSLVTVVEMLDHIGGALDRDIAKALQADLKKEKVRFELGCRVTEIAGGRVKYEKDDGGAVELPADRVLVCIGRRPRTAGFGLETLGPEMERGAIRTDEYLRTSVPGLYAAGDVNGRSMLAHTASREAEVAVNHMAGVGDRMCYDYVPEVIYTNPEAVSVGLTEAAARERGLQIRVVSLPMNYSGRYVAEGGPANGLCKTVVEADTDRVLGVSMISPYASEIIYGVGIALTNGMTAGELRRVIFPHPTVGEIIRESLFH